MLPSLPGAAGRARCGEEEVVALLVTSSWRGEDRRRGEGDDASQRRTLKTESDGWNPAGRHHSLQIRELYKWD